MANEFLHKRGTRKQLDAMTTPLKTGELGVVTDEGRIVIGNDTEIPINVPTMDDIRDIAFGEENIIESVSVDGVALVPDENRNINIAMPTIPSIDGLVSQENLNTTLADYTKTEDLPDEYDDTALSNRVTAIEGDYVKNEDIDNFVTFTDMNSELVKKVDSVKIGTTEYKSGTTVTLPVYTSDEADSTFGADVALTIDTSTYKMTLVLKDNNGNTLATQSIDFPIESMVVNASYSNGTLTLTLQNGTTLDTDISSIISGLVPDTRTIAGVDLKDNITATELRTALNVANGANAYTHPTYTALTGLPNALQNPGFGSSFTITQPVSDETGHITAMNTRAVVIPNAVATSSDDGLMSSTDKTKLEATNVAYGTCSTAAGTAAKVITISGNTNWKLVAGAIITVKFSYTNTAQNPTFNVNSTGAKSVWYNTALITTASLGYAGTANRPMQFVYDGTQYVFTGWALDNNTTYSNASLGQGYGTCATAAATTAKVVTLSSYSLITGGVVAVKFTYDVPASATMNINSKGAKNIFYRGVAITAGIIKAGDIATFIYNGTQYHLLTVDRDGDNNTTYTLTKSGSTITLKGSDGSVTSVADSNTTYSQATTSDDGLMTSEMVTKLNDITDSADSVSFARELTSGTKIGTLTINGTPSTLYAPTNTDTKNTAGSTNSSSKLFLIGATSQATNPQTYSHDTVYIGTDGCVYSNNSRVVIEKLSTTEPTTQVSGDHWLLEY